MGQLILDCVNILENLSAIDALTCGAQRHICVLVSGIVWVYRDTTALKVEQRKADLVR